MAFYTGRYDNRIEKSYRIEVVTPMFLGGADGASAELRAQSIKGMLRFWWRALHPGLSGEELFTKEGKIFGSTEGDEHQKAAFSFYIDEEKSQYNFKNDFNRGEQITVKGRPDKIFNYLTVGLYTLNNEKTFIRPHIEPGSYFTLNFIYRDKEIMKSVEESLTALIQFGGIGSKCRNGFGSLYSNDVKVLETESIMAAPLSSYTAFSKEGKIFNFGEYPTWEKALSAIGKKYRMMRLSSYVGIAKHNYNLRKYLALPIVTRNDPQNKYLGKLRHSKPCFLHVSKLVSGKYRAEIIILPYKYREPIDNSNHGYREMIQKMYNAFDELNKKDVDTIY